MHIGSPIRFARTVDEACAVLDSKKICELASSLNEGVNCTIEQRKYDGQEHAVLRLLFDNKEQWALRMPINPYGKFPEHDLELPLEIMRTTTMLQQCIYKHGMKVPCVHWSCLQWRENPVGYPVVLMDWIEGQPLDWETIKHHPEATAKVLAILAQYVFDLSTLTESREALEDLQALQPSGGMSSLSPINLVTFNSAAERYYKDIDRKLFRILRGTLKNISPLEFRSSIPENIVGHTEHIDCNRPVLFHDDIHPGNIIIDSQHTLRGYLSSLSIFPKTTDFENHRLGHGFSFAAPYSTTVIIRHTHDKCSSRKGIPGTASKNTSYHGKISTYDFDPFVPIRRKQMGR